MRWMETERLAMVETFRGADPEAPTLCEGWNGRRLLAHLVMREHAPLKQLLDAASRPVPGSERRLGDVAAAALTPAGYGGLLARFAAGTGTANPMTWLGDSVQLVEYVIHHEDVRRGGGNHQPRSLPPGQLDALWARLPLMARMAYRRSPTAVTIAAKNHPAVPVHKGSGRVLVSGDPVEVALYISGRQRAADVDVTGSGAALDAFLEWSARET
ncbi:TIGR03085 family metal-binding protein [Arthrobacter sp. SDTb3-6]|uniref:TIGR03085 family metal-binding protein n=1 Tax=Arthrobacter sp. SDTb3-6 TaxID=2713571 RepID=UPI00159D99A1|nr:TIGR03085 family metal-binding protein [Arthrobacter sp. SDTb3-6]NVM99789.1 TIGR03085 family protein [Arthrobacter sp. SDTb3-6]